MAKNMNDYLNRGFDGNSIKAKSLQHIPKLKDCENWSKAEFLGRVKHSFRLSSMDGGLVRYNSNIYYITINQIVVLANLYKWNTGKNITVIQDE